MQIGIGLPNQVRNVDATVIPEWAATAEQAAFAGLTTIGRLARNRRRRRTSSGSAAWTTDGSLSS